MLFDLSSSVRVTILPNLFLPKVHNRLPTPPVSEGEAGEVPAADIPPTSPPFFFPPGTDIPPVIPLIITRLPEAVPPEGLRLASLLKGEGFSGEDLSPISSKENKAPLEGTRVTAAAAPLLPISGGIYRRFESILGRRTVSTCMPLPPLLLLLARLSLRLHSEDVVTAIAGAKADLDTFERMLGWVYDPPEDVIDGGRPYEAGVKVGAMSALSRL